MFKSKYAFVLIGQVVVMALLVGLPTLAQTNPSVEYIDTTEPENVLTAYFNAINLKDFSRAYSYWQVPPNDATLEEFAAGFRDTDRVEAFFRLPGRGGVAAGTAYASIPTIIVATHTDGSTHYFAGCYQVSAYNVQVGSNPPPQELDWFMRRASVVEVEDMDTAAARLDNRCSDL